MPSSPSSSPRSAAPLAHLRTIHRLTRAICRGCPPEQVFELAVESLLEGTQADRASMLLYDPDGVLRFKASHGLPLSYRRQVEGHSPWTPETVDPDPILVPDVRQDPDSQEMLPIFEAYDIAGLAFIPLYCGELLGKFMLYYRDVHPFDEAELILASAVADHVAFAVHRNRIQDRTQAAHDKLDGILRHVGEGITLHDASGRLLYANDAANRLFLHPSGAPAAPPSAQPLDGWEVRDEQGALLDPSQRPWMKALRSGHTTHQMLQVHHPGSGERRWTAVTSSTMPGPDGEPGYAVNVFRDVTPLRQAQHHLETHQHELEHALAQAHQAERRKDEFLAVLGHELRNPLAPIVTALQLMDIKDRSGTAACPYTAERELIARQVAHLRRLVDDLLDVSRITRGKLQLDLRPVELAEIVAGAVEQVSPLLEERGHTVSIQVPQAGLTIAADRVRLTQVVENLLANAARYTPPGGRIEVHARLEGFSAHLAVRDNGVGIRQDLLPHIFDLFVQGPQTIDRTRGGLGLGLTIVRQLTEQHGGRVEAHSDGPGLGAEFEIILPTVDPTLDEPAPAVRGPLRTDQPRHVLVVDDNPDAAQTLADLLRLAGHTVRVAYDSLDALQLAHDHPFDTAILDLGLPVMDGVELGQRLLGLNPAIRLIAVTGYGQPQDQARTEAAGFAHHLVKPVDLDALLQSVDPR